LRTGEYFSKGKFLISGEYLVLHGAKALSVPLKFGQYMKVTEISQTGIIRWETNVLGKPWFTGDFQGNGMEINNTSDEKTAAFIRQLLMAGMELNPYRFREQKGFLIQNQIDFNLEWGLGSSSSLVSNLAYWFDVDLFSFYRGLFDGSGFDVFSARADTPVIYQLVGDGPVVEKTRLHSSVTEHLYFVYLGQKQDSQESVRKFREKRFSDPHAIQAVSDLTLQMIKASEPKKFMELIHLHESLVSGILGIQPVKQAMFSGFQGEIKSLGAWGGDFIMACTLSDRNEVKDYFSAKGMDVVFCWDEIVY